MVKLFLLSLLAVAANCDVAPKFLSETPSTTLSTEEQTLAAVYNNFTIGLTKAIADNSMAMVESVPVPATPVVAPCAAPGVDANSAFGIGHLLAVLNEKIWPVGVPVFDQLLSSTPKTLSDAYELVFKRFLQDPDVTFSSAIFTADKVTVTPSLTKLKVEVVTTDLSQKESVETINSFLAKFIGTPLEENYIPKDASISPAAKAVLIDTLHASEEWSSPASKVSNPPKFNGIHAVDMVEVKGTFQVMESDKALEVVMPFKNARRALSLILPKDMTAAFKGDFGDPQLTNYTSVRVQLPVFKATIRDLEANMTTQCDFKKEENFAQLLDHVFFISLGLEKFETISITGAQINNVEKFKTAPSTDKEVQCDAPIPEDVSLMPKFPEAPDSSATERVITFDRSFTWTLLDQDLGPVVAGSVLSPSPQTKTPSSSPFVFGLENQLGYAKCL